MKRLSLLTLPMLISVAFPVFGDSILSFNEIMYHPATNEPALEWVELRNLLAVDIDISGWSITGGIQYSFASNTIVRGGGYVVVALSPSGLQAATGLNGILGPYTGRLGNNGDTLRLRNNSDRIVDEVTYGVDGDWPVAPDGSGVSLAKRDSATASGPAASWTVSDQIGGTPGADNFVSGAPAQTRLLQVDQSWKVESSGTDLGTVWRQPAYDDSAWASRASVTNGSIPTLFSTGLGANRVALAAGQLDPHYVLTAAAQGAVPTNAMAMLGNAAWAANDAFSTWIGVVNNGGVNINAGGYDFRTTFSLDGFLLSTVQLGVSVAVDNDLTNINLNGAATGLAYSGFAGFSAPFVLFSGFVPGLNTLDFKTVNQGPGANPGGFRARLTGTALARNTNSPLAGGHTTYYFRKSFVFAGDPAHAQLQLNALVADGAVFYLNGVEVYRQNMPPGPVNASTAALSDVASPAPSGQLNIPADALVAGVNVLAVEVHQAVGSPDDPLGAAELFFTPTPIPPVSLAFNEIASATNSGFFVELINYGTNTLSVPGLSIVQDGVTNRRIDLGPVVLAPGAFLAVSNEFGSVFAPGDKLYLEPSSGLRVFDSVVLKKSLQGRSPGGTGPWLHPARATPGASNAFNFHTELVINEIMYNHKLLPGTNGSAPRANSESWLELYNRGTNVVDLTGWELGGGVSYLFTPGQTLAPGGYLVVADDAAALRASYPGATIVGNLGGRLSHNSDGIVLKDPNGNPANEVRYQSSSPWPDYANAGGSSLELRDPNADNTRPEAWAASDETGKASWQTFTYKATGTIPSGSGQPSQWNDFVFGLLGEGECLIDDISVIESPTNNPVQFIANGGFENGLTGWRSIGTHGASRIEVDPDNPGNHVLHIIATGPQEHMHNHIEGTYVSNKTITASREYQISFRARWLAGNHFLNTRLYFNRVARTTELPYPVKNGTPGGPNSRFEGNIGPTFAGLNHQPVIPQPGQAVQVSVTAQDPQGVSLVELWWSANGGAWTSGTMTPQGGGVYAGTIPGAAAGTVVQFYLRGVDGLGAASLYPAGGTNSGALYAVADGQANLTLGHNFRIVMTPANGNLLHALTNVMSNDEIPGTLIYDEQRAYYNVGVRLKGSERGRYSDTRTSFHIVFRSDDLFRGVHPVMLIDRSGAGDSPDNKQEEILIRHILCRAGNIPGPQADMCRVIAPHSIHTGPAILSPRHEDEFIQTAYANGGSGTMWELELIYYPTSTNQFGYKLPQPDNVVGTDFQNLTDDKEFYRYNFIIKNHRDADDYSRFIAFAKTFSVPSGPLLDAQTREVMDVDEWTRTFALESLCGVGDSYTFGNDHNLFMYLRPSDRRFVAFSVDMDFSFNRSSSSPLIGDQNLGTIFSLPGNRRMLYAHALDIIGSAFNASYINYWVTHYASFAPGQNYGSVPGYISSRIAAVNSEINGAGGNTAFNVNGTGSVTTNGNLVTLSGSAPVSVRTIRVNGIEYPVTWTSVSGWTLRVPVTDPNTVLTLQGYDMRGNPLTNTVRTVTVNYTGPAPDPTGAVVINEIMYNPVAPNGGYVELFNTSPTFAFDLSGWRVNGLDYTFPAGSVITNRGFLVLASDRPSYVAAYNTNAPAAFAEFSGNLQNDGETLTLLRPGSAPGQEIVVDKVRYEGVAPWPVRANGVGPSLQLIDATKDNSRVANWSDGSGWRLFSYTGLAGSSPPPTNLLVFMSVAGDVYIDKMSLVLGNVAEAGQNLLLDGGFEDGQGPWLFNGNHTNSSVVTGVSYEGNQSLHIVANGIGGASGNIAQPVNGMVTTNTYTFSFWFLPSTNGTGLKFRITSVYSTGTGAIDFRPVYATPGTANSSAGALAAFPPVWLNEVQPENVAGIVDNFGQHEPWLELYNSGNAPISLDGYYLADNYANLTQWAFPAGATLQPGEFKVVFADAEPGETTATDWHTNFKLHPGSGNVALSWSPGGSVQLLDYLNYTNIAAGRSYGDYPDGQVFDRQEFFQATPAAHNNNAAPPLVVRINEWMAANSSTLLNTNNSNHYDDWLELYNPGAAAANLEGYFLTDNLSNKFQFEIPAGYVIPPHGYLLVWADNHPGANSPGDRDLHVNFALNQGGEAIGLFASDGTLIDAVTFEPQFTDISQGRVPDGSGPQYFLATATPRGPNSTWANRYPVLAPIADVQLSAGQPLSFTANGSDPDSPPQLLAYRLDAGAPTGAVINATSGLFAWTPPPVPSTNVITVRVTDNGTPALSAARSFMVIVGTGFRVSGITHSAGGDTVLQIGAVPGKTYRVEFKDDLGAPTWTPIVPDQIATSGILSVTNSSPGIPQRFFRVQQVD